MTKKTFEVFGFLVHNQSFLVVKLSVAVETERLNRCLRLQKDVCKTFGRVHQKPDPSELTFDLRPIFQFKHVLRAYGSMDKNVND